MKLNRHVLACFAVFLMFFGAAAVPANAAPKPAFFSQVRATLLPTNQVVVELTVKCDPSKTYQFQTFFVFQGETVGWNDEPDFLVTPCGSTRESLNATGFTGVFTPEKAELRGMLNLCRADVPTDCSVVEVRKDVSLHT